MESKTDYIPSMLHKPAYLGHGVEPFDLILEGGAMRGLFTAGVTDFFLDKGLCAQHVIGTSAGALAGYNYVAGEDGRTCYLNTKYCTDPRYLSMKSYVKTGNALGVELMFDEIPNKLDPFNYDAFRKSPMVLTSVSSNLELGDADYHTFGDPKDDLPYLQASSSMPLVSQIVEVDGKKLLDGGICDSVPYLFSMLCGTSKQVVVLTQHLGYKKHRNKAMEMLSKKYSSYPLFLDRIEHRHFEYNLTYRRLQRMHESGQIFVIRPPEPVRVSTMESDPDKLFELYETGYREAAIHWEELQRYLGL